MFLLLVAGSLGLTCGGEKKPEAKIPGIDTLTADEKAAERALFPAENMMPDSYEFVEQEFLEVKALEYVYTADYAVDSDTFELFMTQDFTGVKYINLRAYAGANYELQDAPAAANFDDSYGFAFDHPEQGHIIAGLRHNRLVGILGVDNELQVSLYAAWLEGLPEPEYPDPALRPDK